MKDNDMKMILLVTKSSVWEVLWAKVTIDIRVEQLVAELVIPKWWILGTLERWVH